MTISRVNAISWGIGDKFTSAQANGLDLNGTFALDKRTGQTDTMGSVVTMTGGGRLIPTFIAGADANASYRADQANRVITAAPTAPRTYTLLATGAQSGDILVIQCTTSQTITVVDGPSTATIAVITGDAGAATTWGVFWFTGTNWILLASTVTPAVTPQQTFTANGTFTPSRECRMVVVEAWGGGGGGGGSPPGVNSGVTRSVGGGGGGGAIRQTRVLPCTPLVGISVLVAPGGTGGAAGPSLGSGQPGADGDSTAFGTNIFLGGQGGLGGVSVDVGGGEQGLAWPGGPTAGTQRPSAAWVAAGLGNPLMMLPAGGGGFGRDSSTSGAPPYSAFFDGSRNPTARSNALGPSSAGSNGTNASSHWGGGGGGGGGSGPEGVGGDGGSGGIATLSAGVDASGAAGVSASANTGAGGGGGGGGGGKSTSGGPGAAGGAGASGKAYVTQIRY